LRKALTGVNRHDGNDQRHNQAAAGDQSGSSGKVQYQVFPIEEAIQGRLFTIAANP
jgi:hypothetical protein